MREPRMFMWVLGGTLVALAVALFIIPAPQPDAPKHLPWQIEQVNGTIRVFGVTLGETPLEQLERQLDEQAEISLFRSPEGNIDVEAYFDQVTLSGIRARLVIPVALTPGEAQAMYDRGVRVATLGSGERKVTLATEDAARVRRSPVAALTYLPKANLSPELVERRFGTPQAKIREPVSSEDAVEHWLYPERGLDVALHEDGKEVLQYVPPAEFEARIVDPLRDSD